jgi:hypothetical protein
MATVACKECGTPLDEPSDTPIDDRDGCPKCGSMARAFAVGNDLDQRSAMTSAADDLTIHVPTATARTGQPERIRRFPADAVTVADHTYTVTLTQTPGGAWIAQVYSEAGTQIDMTVQGAAEDALLTVIDAMIPPGR